MPTTAGHIGVMNRRSLFKGLTATAVSILLPQPARAMTTYTARLVMLSAAGSADLVAGLSLKLQPGWKTYWRMPGVAGVPPEFDWAGSENVKQVEVLYPLPTRFADVGDETIGYKDEVVFPLNVEAVDKAKPVQLKLVLNFGVCQDVCIPAKADLNLDTANASVEENPSHWLSRVPTPVQDAVQSAVVEQHDKGLSLALALSAEAKDIFVESTTLAYFGKPEPGPAKGQYRLPIYNIKDAAKLQGKTLRITIARDDRSVEQTVALA